MTSPNSTFTEMVTTTLREHPRRIADNVSDNNALYMRLKQRGKIQKEADGGTTIVEPLDYAENSTFKRYSGYDTLDIQASDVLTAAEYSWVQSAIAVVASGRELRINSGKNALIKLFKARMTNAMRTASNNMSVDLYSTGALSNQMGGLGHIITSDGTGTVGGIVAGTYTWWKNQFHEITGTNAWAKGTIAGYMMTTWLSCVRGADKPDLLVSTHDFYSAYWESLHDLSRYRSNEVPDTMDSVKFQSADVIYDSNDNFSTTGETMYFVNSNYVNLRYHPDANWTPMPEVKATNQDAVSVLILWMGQLTCSNRARQGVMIDAS